jgi:hypothetical protein
MKLQHPAANHAALLHNQSAAGTGEFAGYLPDYRRIIAGQSER